MILDSAIGYYLLNIMEVKSAFETLGFPSFVVIPLAIAKIAGVITLLTRFHPTVMEWAYAGFFFNFILAIAAHVNAGDGEAGGAAIALALLIALYITERKAFV